MASSFGRYFPVKREVRRGRQAPPVILRADFRVPYASVQRLMFDCAAMGIEKFDFQAETGPEVSR